MMRALYTAATGMIAEQTNVDTISHNLANVNTNGYKAERTEFKSLLYQTLQTKTTSANCDQKPVGAQVGLGTRVAATTSIYKQGALLESDNDTDFAIEGDGFFAVRGEDGQTYYTRNGNFTWSIDAAGNTILTDSQGCPVLDARGNEIMVPKGTTSQSMVFSQDGSISYKDAKTGNVIPLNQSFGIYQFNNPAGLEKLSSSRLAATSAGNPLLEGATNGVKASKVCQHYLEGSSVQVADEMVNMITIQRAYEAGQKVITSIDETLDKAVNNVGRV